MDSSVLRQIGTVRERFTALGTFVGFRFTHMRLRVQLQFRLRAENLQKENKPKMQYGAIFTAPTLLYILE